jgi:hypothetical protein
MNNNPARPDLDQAEQTAEETEIIDRALLEMELLYRSRCVQAPLGKNVTIRELPNDSSDE